MEFLLSLISLLSRIVHFNEEKQRREFESPMFAIKVSTDESNPNHPILRISIRSKCVSPVSHVVIWGKDIGALNPGQEEIVEFYISNEFDYRTNIYISCVTSYGVVELHPKPLFPY